MIDVLLWYLSSVITRHTATELWITTNSSTLRRFAPPSCLYVASRCIFGSLLGGAICCHHSWTMSDKTNSAHMLLFWVLGSLQHTLSLPCAKNRVDRSKLLRQNTCHSLLISFQGISTDTDAILIPICRPSLNSILEKFCMSCWANDETYSFPWSGLQVTPFDGSCELWHHALVSSMLTIRPNQACNYLWNYTQLRPT